MNSVETQRLENGRVLLLRLNKPKSNILDKAMIGALRKAAEENIDGHTCAIIIGHAGPHFSFGASVKEHQKEEAAEMLRTFHGMFYWLEETNIPLIAAINGFCLGGGMELASFCHFIFAHPSSKFGQPEINLGVFPPMASLVLPWKCPGYADRLNLTGQVIEAAELKQAGLITQLADDPEAAAIAFAKEHLATKSASSLRHGVRANRMGLRLALKERLPLLEAQYINELMECEDANEGIRSFMEKREPQWRDA